MHFLNTFLNTITTLRITDFIDIFVISFLVYKVILLLKGTRAIHLIKGIISLLILRQLSEWLNLYTVSWVINNLFTVGVILIIVVFQPELRRIFERIGRSDKIINFMKIKEEENNVVDEIISAVDSLSRQKIGALIVIENEIGLSDVIETGTTLDAIVSRELLINIFIPNTPLHDGAVIIRGNTIVSASCILPLSLSQNLSKELGTRHRAAMGLSEKSDALIIVVSEETGDISIFSDAKISRRVDSGTLPILLNKFYKKNKEEKEINKTIKFLNILKKNKKQNKGSINEGE